MAHFSLSDVPTGCTEDSMEGQGWDGAQGGEQTRVFLAGLSKCGCTTLHTQIMAIRARVFLVALSPVPRAQPTVPSVPSVGLGKERSPISWPQLHRIQFHSRQPGTRGEKLGPAFWKYSLLVGSWGEREPCVLGCPSRDQVFHHTELGGHRK